ncbi:MAG: hypothetical protein JRI23_28450 [Deltaproteobacteria bacterium]|jgi:hypothetical protein|nr:hypothetical protein [Deltaproteobacteria bacterium]MBW2536028.1 hypothetical protein [Deltaproteobacteria bacterium]
MNTTIEAIRWRHTRGLGAAAVLAMLASSAPATAGDEPADQLPGDDGPRVEHVAPAAETDEAHRACRRSPDCERRGYCTASEGICIAGSNANCEQSVACVDNGRCTAVLGRCLATKDSDCKRSRRCDSLGRCHAARGICIAKEEQEPERPAAEERSEESSVDYAAQASESQERDYPARSSYRPAEPAEVYLPKPIPYREGDAVPDGYRLESTPRYGLVAAGATVLGATWLISAITAISLDNEGSVDDDPNFDDMYTPMLVPVVGPFITIGTADASGTGAGILALDGVVQCAGLAMFIAGFAAPKVELVPGGPAVKVTPMASTKMTGISLSGNL